MENENENKGSVRGKHENGAAKPPPVPEIPKDFETAWINKQGWTPEYWLEYYAKRISKEPEFREFFHL